MIHGIDVSHWQGQVNFTNVRRSGSQFVFIKATEGEDVPDALFGAHFVDATQSQMLKGAYHFFRASQDAEAQANFFLKQLGNRILDLPPVLDFEVLDGAAPAVAAANAIVWMDAVEKATRRKPMLYTCPSLLTELPDSFSAETLASYPLWIAQYGVSVPKAKAWNFWQYSQSEKIPGVNGLCDGNWFNGDLAALQEFCKGP